MVRLREGCPKMAGRDTAHPIGKEGIGTGMPLQRIVCASLLDSLGMKTSRFQTAILS